MATSFEQLRAHLVDVDDPLVVKRTSAVRAMTAEEARHHSLVAFGLGLLFGVPAAALYYYGHWVWGTIPGLLALLMFISTFGEKSKVADCPVCSAQIIVDIEQDSTRPRQCAKCFEYFVAQGGALVPMDGNTTTETPSFEVPLFKDALWPNGCVACGAPPTRLDE